MIMGAWRRYTAVLTAIAVCIWSLLIVPPGAAAPFQQIDVRPVLAVVKIVNKTQDPGLDNLGDQLSAALLNIPAFHDRYRLVDRAHVAYATREVAFGQSGLPDPGTTRRLGQVLNASQLLVGSVRQEPDERLTVNLALLDAETAEEKEGVTLANL